MKPSPSAHPLASLPPLDAEWLEADGLGGFASGTVGGIRTRRYHAVLLGALTPPTGRRVLVNGFDAWVRRASGSLAISSQRYTPGVTHPDGQCRLIGFTATPWPCWWFDLGGGQVLRQELFVPRGRPVTVLRWTLERPAAETELIVRPFLSGRDYHATHHENPFFRPAAEVTGERVRWCPYPDLPAIVSVANARYASAPDWYRNFWYEAETERGLDATEDLVSPGHLTFNLAAGPAVWVVGVNGETNRAVDGHGTVVAAVEQLERLERDRRAGYASALERSADAYLVDGRNGATVIAGYPWFTDWGRDTFIALRGLCLATGRWREAREILLAWADHVSEGMLPNRFPDGAGAPEYNSVDAALWYVIAVHEYLQGRDPLLDSEGDVTRLRRAVEAIVNGYAEGTRYGIRADSDFLLACGEPGVQLTWMDARVDGREVTPRSGKPVEIQALWLNALRIVGQWRPEWRERAELARAVFQRRFWNPERGCLFDVVDADHVPGRMDAAIRPNQVLAVGGLPFGVLEGAQARSVVDVVERELLTPAGLRTLARTEPGYAPRYEGGVRERDGAYHQGTVWPWLMGPFVEAWIRVRGETAAVRAEARRRFLEPLLARCQTAGLGHLSEITDAEAPHDSRGCPFQAWSVGELLRLQRRVLAGRPSLRPPRDRARTAEGPGRRTPAPAAVIAGAR